MCCRDDDPSGALAWLERRIQDVTLLPASHGEVRLQGAMCGAHSPLRLKASGAHNTVMRAYSEYVSHARMHPHPPTEVLRDQVQRG